MRETPAVTAPLVDTGGGKKGYPRVVGEDMPSKSSEEEEPFKLAREGTKMKEQGNPHRGGFPI